jgi:GPN-loop GTPase
MLPPDTPSSLPSSFQVLDILGSGKSTYCFGKYQLFTAPNRPISIVNLNPANDALPYPCAIDFSSLITLGDVMNDKHSLGPNGGRLVYCMEYLVNFDWLEGRLKVLAMGVDAYVLFDLPVHGQVELSTNHELESIKRIV